MKNIFRTAILFAFSLTFFACEKDEVTESKTQKEYDLTGTWNLLPSSGWAISEFSGCPGHGTDGSVRRKDISGTIVFNESESSATVYSKYISSKRLNCEIEWTEETIDTTIIYDYTLTGSDLELVSVLDPSITASTDLDDYGDFDDFMFLFFENYQR